MPYLEEGAVFDKEKVRLISGAPSGVCASLITIRDEKVCAGCDKSITKGEVAWFCDWALLGKKRRGCAYWHYDCL